MALNFPDAPTVNEVYTDNTSGFSFKWDGYVWQSFTPQSTKEIVILDDISGSFNDSTVTFALTESGIPFYPANAQQLRIVLGGVVQAPITDYTISSSNITFTTAPSSGLTFSGVSLGPAVPIGTAIVADGSITPIKLSTGGPSWNTSGDLYVSGISTVTNALGTVKIGTGNTTLIVEGNTRVTGILTIGTSSVTLNGTTDQVNVGSATTIHTSGFRIGSSDLHSTGLSIVNLNSSGIGTFNDINFTGTLNQNGSPFVASRWTAGTGNDIYRLTGNIGIGTTNPQAKLDVNGTARANRFTVPYGTVLTTYKTNNPSTNVAIEGSPNDRDFWIFRDPADSNSNWGIYHRNIDSSLSESGEYTVPANSISFVGGGTNSPGVTIDLAYGDLQVKRNIKIGNDNIIQWVEVTPGVTEWSFTGGVTSQAITLNPSTIPSTARYVLADVFATANSSDHQNFVLGRNVLTNQTNWVGSRGQQPSGQFGTLTRQAITLTYNGETDGYSPFFGVWYSSQHIPTSGRTIYFNNFGNSGSNGWLYVLVKAYSL